MPSTKHLIGPALAVAVSLLAGHALAQTAGSGTTNREMQRGVPGTDVDLNTRGRAATNGVPGVDVDVRGNANRARQGSDTRASGAGAAGTTMERDASATGQRAARADRN